MARATHWLMAGTTRSTVVPAAKSASVAPARGMLGMS